jgi:hypothetical protein
VGGSFAVTQHVSFHGEFDVGPLVARPGQVVESPI